MTDNSVEEICLNCKFFEDNDPILKENPVHRACVMRERVLQELEALQAENSRLREQLKNQV